MILFHHSWCLGSHFVAVTECVNLHITEFIWLTVQVAEASVQHGAQVLVRAAFQHGWRQKMQVCKLREKTWAGFNLLLKNSSRFLKEWEYSYPTQSTPLNSTNPFWGQSLWSNYSALDSHHLTHPHCRQWEPSKTHSDSIQPIAVGAQDTLLAMPASGQHSTV